MNPAAQNNLASGGDNCGAWSNSNFGNPFVTVRVNPDVQQGWGIRPYDWQFGVAVQQQMVPRVALDISYNRRWWLPGTRFSGSPQLDRPARGQDPAIRPEPDECRD
jgi:hypothetical protein